jgi:hypothetical protein
VRKRITRIFLVLVIFTAVGRQSQHLAIAGAAFAIATLLPLFAVAVLLAILASPVAIAISAWWLHRKRPRLRGIWRNLQHGYRKDAEQPAQATPAPAEQPAASSARGTPSAGGQTGTRAAALAAQQAHAHLN